MQYRKLGKTGLEVSEIGFGAWGIGGGMWGASNDAQSMAALERAIELGLNFIDTAFDYGNGHSESIVGRVVTESGKKYGSELLVATKIPPKNRIWPARADSSLSEVFPKAYIFEYVEKSLENLGLPHIDLMQFHVWQDSWAAQDEWKEAIAEITKQGLVKHWGISINDFQPDNAILAIETGLISVVQVIFNLFEQSPRAKLFPACEKHNIGVIARVPLDEGGLTGQIRPDTVFAPDDWRSEYFKDDRKLELSMRLKQIEQTMKQFELQIPTLAELALRYCLSDTRVSTVIPGMRSASRAEQNCAFSDGRLLTAADVKALEPHAWNKNWYE